MDLSTGGLSAERLAPEVAAKGVGGTGIGAKILYDEVPAGVEWNDPRNCVIIILTLPLEETLPPEASLRTCLTSLAARYARFEEVIYAPQTDALQAQAIVLHHGRVAGSTEVLELILHEKDTVALIPADAGG